MQIVLRYLPLRLLPLPQLKEGKWNFNCGAYSIIILKIQLQHIFTETPDQTQFQQVF